MDPSTKINTPLEKNRVRQITALGFGYPVDIVIACEDTGCPVSTALAMLHMETGSRNVFGHDPVRRGQAYGGNVSGLRYAAYKVKRRLGFGNQGVGPCQLTSTGLQDKADRMGGCWKPLYNMEVGFAYLVELFHVYGSWRSAFQHYNGSGPRAVAYGHAADTLMKHYHRALTS